MMQYIISLFALLSCFMSAQVLAEVSTIANPEWVFEDDFEGSRDQAFWLGEGVYVDYGVIDSTDP